MSHYLDSVHQNVRQARALAAGERASAIRSARQRVSRMGADPTDAALSIPAPSPVGSALSQDVVGAATSAFQSTGPTTAVQEGLSAVSAASSPAALDAARAAQSPYGLAGFDAGVAMMNGAARSMGRVPRAMRPSERAGWLTAFGLEGASPETKQGVMGSAVQAAAAGSPAAAGFVKGAAAAVGAIQSGQTPVAAAGSYTASDAWTGAGIYVGIPAVGGLALLGKAGLLASAGAALAGSALALSIGYALGNRYAVAYVNALRQFVSPTPAALASGAAGGGGSVPTAGTGAGGGPAVSTAPSAGT